MSKKFKLTMKFNPSKEGSRVFAEVKCPANYNSITALIRAQREMGALISLARARDPVMSAMHDYDENPDTPDGQETMEAPIHCRRHGDFR